MVTYFLRTHLRKCYFITYYCFARIAMTAVSCAFCWIFELRLAIMIAITSGNVTAPGVCFSVTSNTSPNASVTLHSFSSGGR